MKVFKTKVDSKDFHLSFRALCEKIIGQKKGVATAVCNFPFLELATEGGNASVKWLLLCLTALFISGF